MHKASRGSIYRYRISLQPCPVLGRQCTQRGSQWSPQWGGQAAMTRRHCTRLRTHSTTMHIRRLCLSISTCLLDDHRSRRAPRELQDVQILCKLGGDHSRDPGLVSRYRLQGKCIDTQPINTWRSPGKCIRRQRPKHRSSKLLTSVSVHNDEARLLYTSIVTQPTSASPWTIWRTNSISAIIAG